VADYANVLFKVVAIFDVINRVPASATTPSHSVFCYSTVAHILTPSVNLAFRPKSGIKNKCRACNLGLGPSSGFKMRPFYNSVWVCRGQQGEIERIHSPPTSSKNGLKSFCEVGYANFRPNVFSAGKRISMEILVGVWLHAQCPVALKDL